MADLKHILADEVKVETPRSARETPPRDAPDQQDDDGMDDPSREENPQYSSLTSTTRRNANGSVSSVFSGNKIRHLKKEDGQPLWRKDIQYEFLVAVFYDEHRVFTRLSDQAPNCTFAEIYIDTLISSSKTSKILKEKLLADQASAITMAMVCLLVNVGRMNTTLNFFPEMRAQLRTYHSIPALQARQDPTAYKQLQDAPRLKSILKGASEDESQPGTMEEIGAAARPRTNPVNLIFVLAQYAPKVSEVHFTAPRDLFDLVMRTTLSSASRARAFLWLIWWYLESDFSREDSLRNPFGPGQEGEGTDGLPLKIPTLEVLTEEQAALENVDTAEEKEFGETKRREREVIVNSEPSPAMTALKRARKEKNVFRHSHVGSDYEGTATPGRDNESPAPFGSVHSGAVHDYNSDVGSPSPPGSTLSMPMQQRQAPLPLEQETPSRPAAPVKPKGPGRGNWRRNKLVPTTTHADVQAAAEKPTPQTLPPRDRNLPLSADLETILPYSYLNANPEPPVPVKQPEHVPTPSHQSQKRLRPLTTHQIKISEYKRTRVRRILERGIQQDQIAARPARIKEGAMLRAWKRIKLLPTGWDSEEEDERARNPGNREKDEEGVRSNGAAQEENNKRQWAKQLKASASANPAATESSPQVRSATNMWMAGLFEPVRATGRDDEGLESALLDGDCGEEASHYVRTFRRLDGRLEKADKIEGRSVSAVLWSERAWRRRQSVVDAYQLQLNQEIDDDFGDRPRLVRKSIAGGRGRGGSSGAGGRGGRRRATGDGSRRKKKKAGAIGDEDRIVITVEADGEDEGAEGDGEDEDMMDVDDTLGAVGDADAAELDEEDRELLGEVDAEESEDEEEDDDDDGEGDEDQDENGDGEADGEGEGEGDDDAMEEN